MDIPENLEPFKLPFPAFPLFFDVALDDDLVLSVLGRLDIPGKPAGCFSFNSKNH